MKEEDRQRAIRLRLARMATVPEGIRGGAIATGFEALDQAFGLGGFPRGRIAEVFGPPACGKTTLLLQSVAHIQEEGLTAAWIDADRTFDPAYAAQLGVAVERLPVAQPAAAEEALEIGRQLVASGGLDLLVVDSAAALVPRLELEVGIEQGSAGLQSRVLASGLRKLAQAAAKTGAAAVFLNQTRSRPEASAGEAETSAGGPPLKLYAAVRLALYPAGTRRIGFRVLKNKVANAFAEGKLL